MPSLPTEETRQRIQAIIDADGDVAAAARTLGLTTVSLRSHLHRLGAPQAPQPLRALVLRNWLATGGVA